VPAYTFPADREDLSVLRVVVRAGMTHDMADLFLADLRDQTRSLEALTRRLPERSEKDREAFRH
jgi:glutamate decarboxylase